MSINKPEYIIVHTEASPVKTNAPRFLVVNEEHRRRLFDKSKLGYYVGYHYFIEKSGKLIQARREDEEGMHTVGYNLKSLSVCLAGNGDVEIPNEAQVKTLREFLQIKAKEYNIPREKIVPHRKFNGAKTCFGSLLRDDWASSLVTPETSDPVQAKITILKQLLALYQQMLGLLKK